MIRNVLIWNKLVLMNHLLWPIVNLLHRDKEFLVLRNNFRVTKNFLITKFDCTWMVPYVFKRSHNCDFWLSLTHDSNLSWVSRFYRKNRIFRPRESSPSKDKNRKSPKNKRRTVNIAKTKNKFLIPPAQAQWTTVENLKRIISKFRILCSAAFFLEKSWIVEISEESCMLIMVRKAYEYFNEFFLHCFLTKTMAQTTFFIRKL